MKLVVQHEEFLTSSGPSCDAEGLSYGASCFSCGGDVFSCDGCESLNVHDYGLLLQG